MTDQGELFDNARPPRGVGDLGRLRRELEDIPAAPASAPELVHQAAEDLNAGDRRGRMVNAILERLERGPATGPELAAITHRFSARIYDLRQQYGKTIISRRSGDGVYVYTLVNQEDR